MRVAAMVFMTAIMAVVIFMLIPYNWLEHCARMERDMTGRMFSSESHAQIERMTDNWYRLLMVDTGISAAMHDYVSPRRSGKASIDPRGFDEYMSGRVDMLLLMIWLILRRLAIASIWAPLALIVVIPAAIDGYLTWRIKRHGFGWTSPSIHRYAWRSKAVLALGFAIAVIAPFPVPPEILPAATGMFALAIGLSLANMPKRF